MKAGKLAIELQGPVEHVYREIRQPTLSQQLAVLRNEGVVDTRREGKNIYYSVADPALLEILAVLYRLYCPKD